MTYSICERSLKSRFALYIRMITPRLVWGAVARGKQERPERMGVKLA